MNHLLDWRLSNAKYIWKRFTSSQKAVRGCKLPAPFFVSQFFQFTVTNHVCPTTHSNNRLKRSLLWSLYHGIMPVNYFSNGQINGFSFACLERVQVVLVQSLDLWHSFQDCLKGKKNHRKGKRNSMHTKAKHLPDLTTVTSKVAT